MFMFNYLYIFLILILIFKELLKQNCQKGAAEKSVRGRSFSFCSEPLAILSNCNSFPQRVRELISAPLQKKQGDGNGFHEFQPDSGNLGPVHREPYHSKGPRRNSPV